MPELFPDPAAAAQTRTDVRCARELLKTAELRLARHPADNVFRDVVVRLRTMQQELEERLRAYPAPANGRDLAGGRGALD